MAEVGEIVQEAVSNITQNATETVGKRPPATMEGMAVAYGSLVIMAVFPVFFGAMRSVKFHKVKLQKEKVTPIAPLQRFFDLFESICFFVKLDFFYNLHRKWDYSVEIQ